MAMRDSVSRPLSQAGRDTFDRIFGEKCEIEGCGGMATHYIRMRLPTHPEVIEKKICEHHFKDVYQTAEDVKYSMGSKVSLIDLQIPDHRPLRLF